MDKDEIILMVKKAIANNSIPFNDSDEFVKLDCSDVDNIAEEVYEALYNAGYREVPEYAVIIPAEEREEEIKTTNEILAERDGLKAEIERLKAVLEIKQKQAVKEFAERLERDSICTTQYEDGTKILTTSNKLIDQAVNIYMQTEGLI